MPPMLIDDVDDELMAGAVDEAMLITVSEDELVPMSISMLIGSNLKTLDSFECF